MLVVLKRDRVRTWGVKMKTAKPGLPLSVMIVAAWLSDGHADSWTCRYADLTREVLIVYPEEAALLPCQVYYAKPDENVLPRVLWRAEHTAGYCERTAARFVEKLTSLGWQCGGSDPQIPDAAFGEGEGFD